MEVLPCPVCDKPEFCNCRKGKLKKEATVAFMAFLISACSCLEIYGRYSWEVAGLTHCILFCLVYFVLGAITRI